MMKKIEVIEMFLNYTSGLYLINLCETHKDRVILKGFFNSQLSTITFHFNDLGLNHIHISNSKGNKTLNVRHREDILDFVNKQTG